MWRVVCWSGPYEADHALALRDPNIRVTGPGPRTLTVGQRPRRRWGEMHGGGAGGAGAGGGGPGEPKDPWEVGGAAIVLFSSEFWLVTGPRKSLPSSILFRMWGLCRVWEAIAHRLYDDIELRSVRQNNWKLQTFPFYLLSTKHKCLPCKITLARPGYLKLSLVLAMAAVPGWRYPLLERLVQVTWDPLHQMRDLL